MKECIDMHKQTKQIHRFRQSSDRNHKEQFTSQIGEIDMRCGWRYFIVLNVNDAVNNIVESKEIPGDGLPVCCDFSTAISFSLPNELLQQVEENTSLKVENGDFHMEAHYLPYQDFLQLVQCS